MATFALRGPLTQAPQLLLLCLLPTALSLACAGSRAPELHTGAVLRGKASWYGKEFHGRPTASGEIYDMNALSAAHRTLPLGTVIRVTNTENGRSLRVRINDRGPFVRGRILDLSRGAARELDMIEEGVVEVRIVILETPEGGGPPRGYRVQVGAFLDLALARGLASELRDDYPDTAIHSDGDWHRVQIPRKKRRKAESLRKNLARRGYDAFVVGASAG